MFSLAYIQQVNAEANGGGICESCNYLTDTFAEPFFYEDDDSDEPRGLCQECVDNMSKRSQLNELGWH